MFPLLYFAFTLFTSASLLFLVQPMIGKMILPRLGGSPAVWNTCMVFFQAMLLAGYGYTHFVTTRLSQRKQLILQLAILFLPLAVLPFSLGEYRLPTETNPIFALFFLLLIIVGLPFFVVATSAPLLQKWFASTGHPASKDPYFLYGASNLGSMLALLLYPWKVEQWLAISDNKLPLDQVHFWLYGYILLMLLVAGCVAMVWKSSATKLVDIPVGDQKAAPEMALAGNPGGKAAVMPGAASTRAPIGITPSTKAKPAAASSAIRSGAPDKSTSVSAGPPSGRKRLRFGEPETTSITTEKKYPAKMDPTTPSAVSAADQPVTWARRLRWIGLAAIPSSLMLGVTSYLTTDVAAIPFFWVIPLSLYLLTFILVFARWPVTWTGWPHSIVLYSQPCLLLILALIQEGKLDVSPWREKLIWFFGKLHITPPAFLVSMIFIIFSMHVLTFFLTTLMCHGELAKDRPGVKHLTEFYLWMSVGGVLGGLFNSLFAPIVFWFGVIEYSIAMVLCLALRPSVEWGFGWERYLNKDRIIGYGVDFAIIVLFALVLFPIMKWGFDTSSKPIFVACLVVLLLLLLSRPIAMAGCLGVVLIVINYFDPYRGEVIYRDRSFFSYARIRQEAGNQTFDAPNGMDTVGAAILGTVASPLGDGPLGAVATLFPERGIKQRSDGLMWGWDYRLEQYDWHYPTHVLIHGGIDHGRCYVDPVLRRDPVAYFDPTNGIGQMFWALDFGVPPAQSDTRLPVSLAGLGYSPFDALVDTQSQPAYAVLGLGAGTLAAHAHPFQRVDFYEIDPMVKRLSRPEEGKGYEKEADIQKDRYFYYLQDALDRQSNLKVILGDGRLKLQDGRGDGDKIEKYYHVICLDAFASDAIPVHLLTKEAVELYLSRLADGGILVFNTTNRYVDMHPILADLAKELDLEAHLFADYRVPNGSDKFATSYVILRRNGYDKGTYNGGPPILRRPLSVYVNPPYDNMPRWEGITPSGRPVWTDNFSNLLSAMYFAN